MIMLVLTRRVGESIYIETDNEVIEVMILHAGGNQVRVGIEANKSVRIVRAELKEKTLADDS